MPSKVKQWDALRNADCKLCPLAETAQHVCLIGRGNLDAKLMIVGEAPGETEDGVGKPFQGRAGKLLNSVLQQLKVDRDEDVYITNSVHCRPPDNRTPEKKEIAACRQYLLDEIKLVKPDIIIALGNPALQSLIGKHGITKFNGNVFDAEFDGHKCKVVASVHPAFVLRQPGYLEDMAMAIEKAVGLVRGTFVEKQKPQFDITVAESVEQVVAYLRDNVKKEVAFDFETTGNRYWDPMLTAVTLGLSTREREAFIIPLYHPESPFSHHDIVYLMSCLQVIFADKRITKVAQNLKFDAHIFKRFGVDVQAPIFDTLLAHYLLDENSEQGLDALTLRYTDYGEYWTTPVTVREIMKKGKFKDKTYPLHSLVASGRSQEIPMKDLADYCGRDSAITLELAHKFGAELDKDKKLRRVFDLLLMPGTLTLLESEEHGMLIDRKFALRVKAKFEQMIKNQEEELNSYRECKRFARMLGKPINYNSPPQMAQLLFSEVREDHSAGFDYDVIERTEKGHPSSKSEVIDVLLKDHPDDDFLRDLVEYRKTTKFLSTYIIGIMELMDAGGRIHPSFKLNGTVTGRLSCVRPNLQNIPRETTSKDIKGMFIAPPGYTFIQVDTSQAELRLMAAAAGEKRMLSWFRDGKDVHLYVAAETLGKKPELGDGRDQVHKAERKNAKTVNFGIVYMVGKYTLAESLSSPETCPKCSKRNPKKDVKGITKCCNIQFEPRVDYTPDEAQEFLDNYFELFPDIKLFLERMKKKVDKYKQVRSVFGNIRRIQGAGSDNRAIAEAAYREGVNSPIQGGASHFTLFCSNYIHGRLDGKRKIPKSVTQVNTVHDMLLFECPIELVDTVAPLLKQLCDNAPVTKYFHFEFGVPMLVDVEVGNRWSEVKSYTPK